MTTVKLEAPMTSAVAEQHKKQLAEDAKTLTAEHNLRELERLQLSKYSLISCCFIHSGTRNSIMDVHYLKRSLRRNGMSMWGAEQGRRKILTKIFYGCGTAH